MTTSSCATRSSAISRKGLTLAVSGALALAAASVHAATVGHSRLVSLQGQPLHITVQLRDLAPGDVDSLSVSLPPGAQWAQAGLTPPAPLSALSVSIQNGYSPGTRSVQIRSSTILDKPVVDLLIDLRTASGQQRHQVSLLAQGSVDAVAPPAAAGSGASGAVGPEPVLSSIPVRKGDTLFALARRHSVAGVSDYQMMVALYRANPQAFIHKNLNLVKAGATLQVPDRAALTAISDREARRIFQEHARAFALYRQRLTSSPDVATVVAGAGASAGRVQEQAITQAQPAQTPSVDRLRLSESTPGGAGGAGSASQAGTAPIGASTDIASTSPSQAGAQQASSDDKVALGKAIGDAENRVSQLQENVQQLNQALQAQGQAAGNLGVAGAQALADAAEQAASTVAQATQKALDSAGSAAETTGTINGVSGSGQSAASAAVGSDSGQPPIGTGQSASAAASSSGGDSVSKVGASGQGVAASAAHTGGSTSGAAAAPSVETQKNGATAALAPSEGAGAGASAGKGAPVTAGSPSESDNITQRAKAVAEPVTQKAEQTVSWLQENMLMVIGGLLAFIVLVLAWLLRRGGSRRSDDDASQGVITEAMIKDKLESINLDLDAEPDQPNNKR